MRPQRQCHLQNKQNQIQQPRHRKKQRHQFLEGSIVEVSSYEPDFKDVWFVATIINLPSNQKGSPNYGKYYVQYKDILDDEDITKPHRDYVATALVRPLPPVDNHPASFKIGDKVDAFCKDGWWTGVVSGVLEGSIFHVTFQEPPDEALLRSSDLRIHRVWVKGSWHPPFNQDVSFPSDESNIVNINSTIGDTTPLSNSVSMTSSFEEQTPFSSISRENKFALAVPSSEPLVIDPSPREMILDSLHSISKEALNGEAHACVPSPGTNDYKSGTTSDEKLSHVARQDYISVENDNLRQPLGGADQSHESHSLRKRRHKNSLIKFQDYLHSRILDSLHSISKEALNGEAHACMPSPGTNDYKSGTTSDEKLSHVARQDYISVENDNLRQPLGGADQSHESHSLRKRRSTKRVKIVENEENALAGSRKTEENKVQVKKLQNSAGGKVGNEAEDVPVDCLTVDTNLSVVLGLACDNLRTSGSKRSYRSNGEESVKRVGGCDSFYENKLHAEKVTNQFEVINGSQKKRRGRPPKSLDKALTTSILDVNVEASAEASAPGHVVGTNGTYGGASNDHIMQDSQSGMKSVPSPLRIGSEKNNQSGNSVPSPSRICSEKNNQSGIKSVTSPSRIGSEISVEASRKQHGRHPTIQDRKRTTKLNLISKVHDVGNTAEANYMNGELDRDIEELPDNSLDNLPLSRWIGNFRSPASIDSPGSSFIRNIAEASGEDMEIVKEGTAAVDEIRHSGIVLQNSPFEKKSILWQSLESMDVFQKLPQKLHFQPLEHVKESLREGLAVGYMVAFTGIVERTSKMRFDDPKCSTDDIMETLLELETHGFDVGGIRERLNKLGQMKERQEKLEEEMEKLNNEMAEHKLEKSKIDEEMEGIKKQIHELQEKLSKAVSMKQIKSGEIESLQLKLKSTEEGISSIHNEFEGQGSWP